MTLEKVDVRNQAKWYETRRNELLQLLERTTKLEIPQNFAEELAAARKKCLENYFEIVLVGEFQGGKSTTFDALCDGRDLSPRGLGGGGIKTSAAKISAQNISDGETKNGMEEWVEIDFKSKFDIQMSMFDILHKPLSEDREFRRHLVSSGKVEDGEFESSMSTAVEFAELLDLDASAQRQAVRRTLDDLWSRKKDLSTNDKDRLRIATLQERFYGTEEYRELISRTVVGVYDFQKMVAFPRKWASRWLDGQNTAFSLEEVTFVFIADTLLRIKSENLARLGCRITDCPGLFANACDTNVAKQAILKADAVWYLINGEHMIGETDLNEIGEEIRALGREDNIIGSVNIKGPFETKMNVVLPETEARLRDDGFTFKVLPYQARLAFLANLGKRMVEKNPPLSDHEIACMRRDAENPDENATPETLWVDMINGLGGPYATRIPELKDIETLSAESVEIVREKSLIDDIMMYLGQKIIPDKSERILVRKGSKRAVAALQEYEGQLKESEDAATQKKEEWEKKAEEAERKLKEFIAKANEDINKSALVYYKEDLSSRIAHDLSNKIFDRDFIKKIAERFTESWFKIAYAANGEISDEEHYKRTMDDAKQPINNDYQNKIVLAFNLLGKDKLSKSWPSYVRNFEDLKARIEERWQEASSSHEYINALTINYPSNDDLLRPLQEIQEKILDRDTLKVLWDNGGWFSTIFETLWSGIIGLLAFLVPKSIKKKFAKLQKAAKIKEKHATQDMIANRIQKRIEEINFRDKAATEYYTNPLLKMHDDMVRAFRNAVNGLDKEFQDKHLEPARRNFNESEKKRREIAEANRKIRVEQIEPLRKEIQDFEKQVKAELARR